MEKEKVYEFCRAHRFELLGAAAGFGVAAVILSIGFFKTLFVFICTAVGYYIGKKLSQKRDFFQKMLDRILPPGTYR